jgi:hypothetical protein
LFIDDLCLPFYLSSRTILSGEWKAIHPCHWVRRDQKGLHQTSMSNRQYNSPCRSTRRIKYSYPLSKPHDLPWLISNDKLLLSLAQGCWKVRIPKSSLITATPALTLIAKYFSTTQQLLGCPLETTCLPGHISEGEDVSIQSRTEHKELMLTL